MKLLNLKMKKLIVLLLLVNVKDYKINYKKNKDYVLKLNYNYKLINKKLNNMKKIWMILIKKIKKYSIN
jgi:hypothetical protein